MNHAALCSYFAYYADLLENDASIQGEAMHEAMALIRSWVCEAGTMTCVPCNQIGHRDG